MSKHTVLKSKKKQTPCKSYNFLAQAAYLETLTNPTETNTETLIKPVVHAL